jgi:cation transport ATPase
MKTARVRSGMRRPRSATVQLAVAVGGLAAGGGCRLVGSGGLANVLWAITAAGALLPATISMARDLLRRRAGVEIVAVLALLGSLVVGEYLAGAVIALMLATGRELEARAWARARRELTALLDRAPTVVHCGDGDTLTTPAIEDVRCGDVLVVAPGEVVPVDGQLAIDIADLDESALTGEAALVERSHGDAVLSGGVNAGAAFRLRATAAADESTYAGIVRLVRLAQDSRAPLVRVADRFALWFVALTVGLAALAVVVARREHGEVSHLARVLGGTIDALEPGGASDDEVGLRRILYSLYAVLSLHRTGDEERLSRVVVERDEPPMRKSG